VASNIRAMPENEKPPARRVDVYCFLSKYIYRYMSIYDKIFLFLNI
jgi:hypothetical protein